MATQTHYLTDTLVGGWQSMSTTSPGADAYASPVTGWIVSNTTPGASDRSQFEPAVERAVGTFATGSSQPDGTLDTTLKDAWLIDPGGAGDYASANWTINGVVRANTNGGSQDGRLYYRLFKADADGTNATEITAAAQQGALLTNVSNAADFNSSVTFNPGAFSVTATQRIFIQLAWERTGPGGMATADINFRIGTNSTRVVTADFTAGSTNYTADVSETVSLSESLAAGLALGADVSENVGTVTESLAAAYAAIASPGETVSLSESLGVQQSAAAAIGETVSLSESVNGGLQLDANLSESVGALGELVAAGYEARPAPSETVALSESASVAYIAQASPVETVAVAGELASAYAAIVAATEGVGAIGESITASSGSSGTNYTADVSESVTVLEAIGVASSEPPEIIISSATNTGGSSVDVITNGSDVEVLP